MKKANAALLTQNDFLKKIAYNGQILAARLEASSNMVINTRGIQVEGWPYSVAPVTTLPEAERPLMYALDLFRDNKRKITSLLNSVKK